MPDARTAPTHSTWRSVTPAGRSPALKLSRNRSRGRPPSLKRREPGISFHKGDLHQIRFAELFHLIFSMHVLTYLKNDLEVLKRFSRALKRGGYLILSIPTPPAPLPCLARSKGSSSPPVRRSAAPPSRSNGPVTRTRRSSTSSMKRDSSPSPSPIRQDRSGSPPGKSTR